MATTHHLYTGKENAVVKIDPSDGSELDRYDYGSSISSVTTDVDGNIYFGAGNQNTVKLDPNFNVVYDTYVNAEHKDFVFSSDGNYVYGAGDNYNRLQKIDVSTGDLVWENFDPGNSFGITVDDSDNIYVSEESNQRITKIDSTGTTQWQKSAGEGTIWGVAWYNGTIITSDHTGYIIAYDDADVGGTRLWERHAGDHDVSKFYSDIVVRDDGIIHVGGDGGEIVTIDSSDGTILSNKNIAGEARHLSLTPESKLYVGDRGNNELFKYDTENQSKDWTSGDTFLFDGLNESVTGHPKYESFPDSWSTTVKKSATATKVGSSSTQKTASGAIAAAASATKVASTSGLNTVSGATTSAPIATKVSGATTMATSSGTSSSAASASKYGGSASMQTVRAAVPVVATKMTSSATMQTPSASRGVAASSSKVTADTSFPTPSTISSGLPSESDFSYAGNVNGLYKYNSDGTKQWSVTSLSVDVVETDSDRIAYVGDSGSNEVYAYDETGSQLWSNSSLTFDTVSLKVGEDTLYLVDNSGDRLFRLNKDTGDEVWTGNVSTDIVSSAIDSSENIYIGGRGSTVTRYDRAGGGSESWVRDFSTDYGGDALVFTDGAGYIYANITGGIGPDIKKLNVSDGSTVTTNSVDYETVYAGVVDDNANLYVGYLDSNSDYYLERYDLDNNTVDWSNEINSNPQEIDVTVHGNLYTTFYNGTDVVLNQYDMSDGSFIETLDTSGYSYDLGMYPEYAANQSAWTPTSTASITVEKTPGSSTMSAASGEGLATPASTKMSASASPFTPDALSSSGASASKTGGTATMSTGSGTGIATPSGTKVAGSSTMFSPVGATSASPSATKVVSTATLFTAINGVFADATKATASTTMQTPSGTSSSTPSATKVAASASTQTPSSVGTADVSSTKVPGSTTPLTTVGDGLVVSVATTVTASSATKTGSARKGTDATSTPVSASTTMQTPSGTTTARPTSVKTIASASFSSTPVYTASSVSATKVASTATEFEADAGVLSKALAGKYGATTEMRTSFTFIRQIRTFDASRNNSDLVGSNGSSLTKSKNTSELSDSDNQ